MCPEARLVSAGQTNPPSECGDAIVPSEIKRIRLGTIHADSLSMSEALDVIDELIEQRSGGFIVTPNVDHVVLAERSTALREAYAKAALSLVDGMPLVWAGYLLGHPFPEKISGSDLAWPLLQMAARAERRVYLLGGAPGVGEIAAGKIRKQLPGIKVVGIDAPPLGFDRDNLAEREAFDRMQQAGPDLVFVALGCPKQELLMHRWFCEGTEAIMVGVGATLDFISGKVKRAPSWMSMNGLEWLYRMTQDPWRLSKRYLVRDIRIVRIVARTLMMSSEDRVVYRSRPVSR